MIAPNRVIQGFSIRLNIIINRVVFPTKSLGGIARFASLKHVGQPTGKIPRCLWSACCSLASSCRLPPAELQSIVANNLIKRRFFVCLLFIYFLFFIYTEHDGTPSVKIQSSWSVWKIRNWETTCITPRDASQRFGFNANLNLFNAHYVIIQFLWHNACLQLYM